MFCETRQPLEVLPLFGLIGGVLSGFVLWAAPDIAGSGIPQVRAVLNRMSLPLDLRIALAKLIGGTISLGSGLFMGREGPTVQVGAALAGQLSRWIPTTVEHRRYLIAAGAGAGLAAAFSAPIAGVVFVIEELLKEFKPVSVALAIVACFSAFWVEQFFEVPHKIASHPEVSHAALGFNEILFLILLAIVCGVLGTLFNRGIMLSLKLYRKLPVVPPVKVGLAGLLTGTIVALMPVTLHNYAATRAMINSGTAGGDVVPLVACGFTFLTFLAYGSGAPGGLFAPCLTIGSALGFMVGVAEQYWTGSGSVHVLSLVGMGAFFSAVSRAPLTSIIIVFEMVSEFSLVPSLMLSCVIASAVGDYFYKGGLYDLLMVWNGLHLKGPSEESEMKSRSASDVMKGEFETIESDSSLKAAEEVFERSRLPGLPVVKKGKLIGVLLKSNLPVERTDAADVTVDSIMLKHPMSVSGNDSLDELLFLFGRYQFEWIPVTDGSDRLIGVIWKTDLITSMFPQTEN